MFMSLDALQWDLIKATFAELTALDADARARRLSSLAASDPLVYVELVGLLAASDSVGDRFEEGAAAASGLGSPEAGLTGQTIGPWQVVREIGQGGMGAVYEAHRIDDQYTKRVAIKTIATGRTSDSLLQRFRHERQILARLEHPNIATLLDGGVTTGGQPYFVMEYADRGSLADRIRARPGQQFSINDSLSISREIAEIGDQCVLESEPAEHFGFAVGTRDLGTSAAKTGNQRTADAATGAGDEHVLAVECEGRGHVQGAL